MWPTSEKARGFTLTELLITAVLMGLILGAVWMMYGAGLEVFHNQSTRVGVKGEAGRAFVTMTEELRHATSVTSAQSASVTFAVDTDDNGVDESIQYSWSGTSGNPLQRVATPTKSLVNSVTGLTFSYYDSSNNLLTSPVTASLVRAVAIDLTVTSQDETFHLRSQVRLRNL